MTLTVSQSATFVGVLAPASFVGVGGVEPYLYSVLSGGAGGSIDVSTGMYAGPATLSLDPRKSFDTILVEDYNGDRAEALISVGSALMLLCDILKKELGLADGRVYLWDQKIMQPTDAGLYIAVSEVSCKPFANNIKTQSAHTGDPLDGNQYVCMLSRVEIDIISRDISARERKEEILMALGSIYSEQQQTANGFSIARLSSSFMNLSQVDGAAIPYRYKIAVNMQYSKAKTKTVEFFDNFELQEIINS